MTQLSHDIFDPRNMDTKFLEAKFEDFRVSTARDDKNDNIYTSSFLSFF